MILTQSETYGEAKINVGAKIVFRKWPRSKGRHVLQRRGNCGKHYTHIYCLTRWILLRLLKRSLRHEPSFFCSCCPIDMARFRIFVTSKHVFYSCWCSMFHTEERNTVFLLLCLQALLCYGSTLSVLHFGVVYIDMGICEACSNA